jgi:hypothetical protein
MLVLHASGAGAMVTGKPIAVSLPCMAEIAANFLQERPICGGSGVAS